MRVERRFAYCCAEGGGRVEYCDCINKDHGTAWRDTYLEAKEDALAEGLAHRDKEFPGPIYLDELVEIEEG